MFRENIWKGATNLVDVYAGVCPGDRALVIYSSDSAEPAIWCCAALEARSVSVARLWMRPLEDSDFAARLDAALPAPDEVSGRLFVFTLERSTMSHTIVLASALKRYAANRCVVFRAISACPELFSTALNESPELISKRNVAILERLTRAERLRVTTRGGTDVRIELDNARHRWISNRGIAKAGGVVVLPAGEVAGFPKNVDGVFVADFAFNVNAITERDSRLNEHPVFVRIEEGRAVDYDCSHGPTLDFLRECFQTHCAFNVGEIGFGTNHSIGEPIFLNSHINERKAGIHLGFGQHNQDPGVVGYQCPIHLDLIATGGLIEIDGSEFLDLEDPPLSDGSHPTTTRDEDVFSPESYDLEIDDCCGILTNDGLKLMSDLR